MKLHLGYIFSKGIDVVRGLGLNEWCINEGADKFSTCEIEIEGEATRKFIIDSGLSDKESLIWYINEVFEYTSLKDCGIEYLRNLAHALKDNNGY